MAVVLYTGGDSGAIPSVGIASNMLGSDGEKLDQIRKRIEVLTSNARPTSYIVLQN